MTRWRFGDTTEDGEAWLKHPSLMFAYVDYESKQADGRVAWRRMVVATKTWLDLQLASVSDAQSGSVWTAIPAMVVLPDVEGEELRRRVDAAVQENAFDFHSIFLADA